MRTIKKADIDNDWNLLWNELVDILAMEEYEVNESKIKAASLAFWYDSELQNGGHLQYFENRGTENADETVQALMQIGAKEQADVFKRALAIWKAKVRKPVEDLEEYVMAALEEEFAELDSQYYECNPDMNNYLEKCLENNKGDFFKFE